MPRRHLLKVFALALGCTAACTRTPPLAPSATALEREAVSALDAGSCVSVWCERPITPGVIWRRIQYPQLYGGPQSVNVLDIDLSQPGLVLQPVQSLQVQGCQVNSCQVDAGCYETVSSMAARTGALAAINGGFFCNGEDDICTQGSPPPCTGYQAFSLLQVGGQSVSTNCLTARTTFGLSDAGVSIQAVDAGQPWLAMTAAIGAGPRLVVPGADGGGQPSYTTEGFPWIQEKTSRTAVGLTADGHLLWVAVDGSRAGMLGMSIPDLADYLATQFQSVSAMNFDGGGSTTLYVKPYGVVNVPNDGCERRVYDGLFLYTGG